jgi:hypothetical protein
MLTIGTERESVFLKTEREAAIKKIRPGVTLTLL